jgi:hypothetical protein
MKRTTNSITPCLLASGLILASSQLLRAADSHPKDLNPVTFRSAPAHPPVALVANGQPQASIVVMGGAGGPGATELQRAIKDATGAELPIVRDKVEGSAIVIGDCDLAKQQGLEGAKLPPEGLAIKTAAGRVFIVGNGQGAEWGCYEFLERFVGVRWYWPTDLGRSVPKAAGLTVAPVWLEDAPVFRKREIWPPFSDPWRGRGVDLQPVQRFLRSGDSWPISVRVHEPEWNRVEDYVKNRPEVFQLRSDGTRDTSMICYGNPKTLATYLENLDRAFRGQQPVYAPVKGDAITVSPADAEIACYCPDCRKLWDETGGQYGSASKILGTFVAQLGREVKKRWPGKTIIYLPYLNYTRAPSGIEFPDNVEVQLCGMPGMAMYKQPSLLAEEQANVEQWRKLTGRKIQNWHYSCWPENRTPAMYHYAHVVRDYYRLNRDNTVGTFINGEGDHWPRQNFSLVCWLKVLWNPAYDVDAAREEFCARMFGPAATTMGELLQLQIQGWEQSRWPGGRLFAKAIFEISYPRATVLKMEELLQRARQQARGDALTLQRLDYYAAPFAAFFTASKNFAEGGGLRPLQAQKVGENPKLDGQLAEAAWSRAQELSFVGAYKTQSREPKYPTTVRAVWTAEGITFGFRMAEPTPELLEMDRQGHDDSNLWWDDNIELLFDVTGKNEGEFYHFIVTPRGTVMDFKGKDVSWNTDKVKFATHVGKDAWSAEVFVPFAAFAEAVKPISGSASQTQWYGNFTRHRVADKGLESKKKPVEGSVREYTRANTTFAEPSNNLADFAPIQFVE